MFSPRLPTTLSVSGEGFAWGDWEFAGTKVGV